MEHNSVGGGEKINHGNEQNIAITLKAKVPSWHKGWLLLLCIIACYRQQTGSRIFGKRTSILLEVITLPQEL